jgi:hypothetical protein
MPGITTPTLLQMSQGYQTGGFVINPLETVNYQPPQITAETTPPPPSVDGGGTGATGTDFSDPAAIAASLGFDPSQYSEYFTAITPEMQAATQEETYDPFYAEQIEQIRGGIQGRTEGLRQNLLQSAMQAQEAGAASGFAGGAAGGARTQQLMRQSAEQQQAGIGRQYEAQRRGVQEQIASRIGAAQDAIERAKQQNIATARGLIASGAEFGFTPQVPGTTPEDIITQFDTPEQRYGNMQTADSLLAPTQMPNALPRGPSVNRPIGAFDPRTIRGY